MEIIVIDYAGNQRDLAYLRAKYGNFIIKPAAAGSGPVYKISHLLERADPPAEGKGAPKGKKVKAPIRLPEASSAMIFGVINPQGQPMSGQEMAFYWTDAPEDPNAGPLGGVLPQMVPNRCHHGPTNAEGLIGNGMGPGAYYWPDQGQIGPHAGWAHGSETRSDLILGLGMIAATNHDHFDVVWTLYPDDPEPPPPEEIEELIDGIRRRGNRIAAMADELARLLGYSTLA